MIDDDVLTVVAEADIDAIGTAGVVVTGCPVGYSGITGYSGYWGTPFPPSTLGYPDREELPEWLRLIKDQCNVAYLQEIEAVKLLYPSDQDMSLAGCTFGGTIEGNKRYKAWISCAKSQQNVYSSYAPLDKALHKMEDWWGLDSMNNITTSSSFDYILAMWLMQDRKASSEALRYFESTAWIGFYELEMKYGSVADGIVHLMQNGRNDGRIS
jgi:hypothetical protein